MPAPAREPFFFGTVAEEGPFGTSEIPLAVVIQRRMTGAGEMWIVACPYCGGVHEHGVGPGEGARGSHCGAGVYPRGDYYMCAASSHLPLFPNSREGDAELRRKGWIGNRPRLRLVCTG